MMKNILSFLSELFFIKAKNLSILAFTAPGGVATPFAFNINFLPQFITWNNVVPLTSLRVSTKKDGVLHDWTAAMIAAMNNYMLNGALPANNVLLRIASGDIQGQDVTISGVTSAAGAIGFFLSSDNKAGNARPFKSKAAQILALTPTMFENFTALFIPTLAAGTDRVEIEYTNGHRQIFELQEINALSVIFQATPGVIINNVNSYIHRVWVTCAAATPAYILEVNL